MLEVVKYKPKMTMVPCPESKDWKTSTAIPFDDQTVALVKADGEFNILFYKQGIAWTENRNGRKETALTVPAIKDYQDFMNVRWGPREVVVKAEMHVRDQCKTKRVGDFIHALKGKDKAEREKIHLGIFDIVQIDFKEITNCTFKQKLALMNSLIDLPMARVYILPNAQVSCKEDVEQFWNLRRNAFNYEGLVVHTKDEVFKLKPDLELDAVVVGLETSGKGFKRRQGSTLRVAVMPEPNVYLEIGDIGSGINNANKTYFYQLWEKNQIELVNKVAYMKPTEVINIKFTDFYQQTGRKWKLENGQRVLISKASETISMRHPRMASFRKDKKPIVEDVGLNQFPER